MPKISGEFEVGSMSEETYQDLGDGGKLTRAGGTQAFSGGLTGEGTIQWLMCYRADGSARFVGLQRVDGAVEGREGTFIIEAKGDFDGTGSKGTWTVIPGSGSGALEGLRGEGEFQASHGPKATFNLDYRFE
jgi:hypothetical protein